VSEITAQEVLEEAIALELRHFPDDVRPSNLGALAVMTGMSLEETETLAHAGIMRVGSEVIRGLEPAQRQPLSIYGEGWIKGVLAGLAIAELRRRHSPG
jgi:hypothetical protein